MANRRKGQKRESVPVRNYVFKVKRIVEGEEIVAHQMHLAHRYRNKLVEIEREKRTAIHQALAEFDPEYPRLLAEIAAGERSLAEIDRRLNARSQGERKRVKSTGEERGRIKELLASREALYADLKAVKKAAFADESFREMLRPIEESDREARHAARKTNGLYWGTYYVVEAAAKEFSKGAPPEFRGWDPYGTVGTWISNSTLEWCGAWLGNHRHVRIEKVDPADRPTHSRSGAFLPPPDPESNRSKRNKRMAVVWLRIGSNDDPRKTPVWAKVLIHLHREPPPDAIISSVFLHRSLVGGRVRWDLRFVLRREEWPTPRGDESAVGIDLRWRRVPEGLLVATAVGSDGAKDELILGDEILEKLEHAESIREIRDREYNQVRARFSAWLRGKRVDLLSEDAPDEDEGRSAEKERLEREFSTGRPVLPDWLYGKTPDGHYNAKRDVRYLMRWRSPEKLSLIVRLWGMPDAEGKSRRFPGDHAIYKELEHWRTRIDRHLHDYEDHERRKVLRRRDELQRRFASRISRAYRSACLTGMNFAKATKTAPVGEEDNPMVRTYARFAAPGQLRAFLVEKMGDDVRQVPGKDFSTTCHLCGAKNKVDTKTTFDVTCSGCGAAWNLSENAARNYLDAARSELAG